MTDDPANRVPFRAGARYEEWLPSFRLIARGLDGDLERPNLLAPIALSASPTAYGSLRMEPQYVALGEAAGIAAALASRNAITVASVDVADVQDVLRSDGVLFTLRDLCRITPAGWRSAGGYHPTTCAAGPVEPRAVG